MARISSGDRVGVGAGRRGADGPFAAPRAAGALAVGVVAGAPRSAAGTTGLAPARRWEAPRPAHRVWPAHQGLPGPWALRPGRDSPAPAPRGWARRGATIADTAGAAGSTGSTRLAGAAGAARATRPTRGARPTRSPGSAGPAGSLESAGLAGRLELDVRTRERERTGVVAGTGRGGVAAGVAAGNLAGEAEGPAGAGGQRRSRQLGQDAAGRGHGRLHGHAGGEPGRQQHEGGDPAIEGVAELHADVVAPGEASVDGQAELPRDRGVHRRWVRKALVGALQLGVAHADPAVLDLDHVAGGARLAADPHDGPWRGEAGGVLDELGQQVHDLADRVAGQLDVVDRQHLDTLVVLDLLDGAADHVHQRNGLEPAPRR